MPARVRATERKVDGDAGKTSDVDVLATLVADPVEKPAPKSRDTVPVPKSPSDVDVSVIDSLLSDGGASPEIDKKDRGK
jgi:hypothetical protein